MTSFKTLPASTRFAFTLIELMVALAVLTVTVGLALPMLNGVRECARAAECSDRLREIAIGIGKFTEVNGRLPPAALFHNEPVLSEERFSSKLDMAQWTSSLALCWPYLEMNNLAELLPDIVFDMDRLLVDDPDRDSPFNSPETIDNVGVVLATQIPQFECPSDNINEIAFPHPAGIPDITMSAYLPRWDGVTPNDHDWAGNTFYFTNGQRVMRTNFISCMGAHGHLLTPEATKYAGCMTTRKRVTREDIKDGTTRTIMLAENIGGIFNSERGLDIDDDDLTQIETSTGHSHFWGGLGQGRGNIPFETPNLTDSIEFEFRGDDHETVSPDDIPMLGDARFSPIRGFGAMHPAGINAAMADLSVRMLSREIDWRVLYQLCGMADGGTPAEEEF